MKNTKGSFLAKNLGRALGLLALASTQTFGGTGNTFNYATGDVLICFRPATPGLGSDLIVDAGPVSTFTNLAPNTKINITSYNLTQLSAVTLNNGANDLAWSAWAYFDDTATPASAQETMFMTNPRGDLNTQTDPYYRATASGQGLVIGKLTGIVAGAVNNAGLNGNNSPTAVLVSESYNVNNTAYSYYFGLKANKSSLDFGQTFQAAPDQYTWDTFSTDGTPVRADFYWLPPAADFSGPPGIFLGYFELSPDGSMTYTAYPSAVVTAPTIVSYIHTGTTNTITFTTGNSGTYTLRGTDSAGLATARTNWPAINSVSGDGGTHALSDTSTIANKFYVITAQ